MSEILGEVPGGTWGGVEEVQEAGHDKDDIKNLKSSLLSNDWHIQTLNTTIEGLEMEKRQLEANSAADKPQLEADRAALEKLKQESKGSSAGKTHTRELKDKVKDLEICLSTKDSHMQTLNATIQVLEKDKQQLKATAAADRPQLEADRAALGKLRDESKAGKMRVRELEAKIKDLGTCLSTKDSHMKTLNSTIQGLEKEKQQLEATAAAEKPQIQADCAAWGILKDKVQAGNTRAHELEDKIKDLKLSLSSKDSHTQTLNSTINALETEKQRLEVTAAADKPQIDADRAALKKLRGENNQAHTQVLNSTIKTLEAEKRKLEEIAAPQIEADRANLLNLKKEAEASAVQIRALEREIKDLVTQPDENEREKILAENASLKSLAAQDQTQLLNYQINHVAKAHFDALETDYYQLQGKLIEKAQEIVSIKQCYETEELQALRGSLAELQAQHAAEKFAKSSAQARLAALQNEIATVTHERDELNSRVLADQGILGLQDNLAKLRRVTSLEQEVENLKQERDCLKESSENATLLSQIEELRAERDRHKDEFNAQSAGRQFLSSHKNCTLSRANVNAEMRYAKKLFPSYRLADPVAQSSASSSSQSASSPGSAKANSNESNSQQHQDTSSSRSHLTYRAPWQKDRFSPFLVQSGHESSDSDNDNEQRKSSHKKKRCRISTSALEFSSKSSSSDAESCRDEAGSGMREVRVR
ncbi:MAG: hypothetical protein NXY57DRAFT_978229 [Lentinula lateritia]|nr:MAG: hypothetical protein NXY57DRAFT_978229 [Lentinula lateritia]